MFTKATTMVIIPSSTLPLFPNTTNTTILAFYPRTTRRFKPLLASSNPETGSPADQEPTEVPDPVKLAFTKAEAYKNSKLQSSIPKPNPAPEAPDPVQLAMEKAKEYKKSKAAAAAGSGSGVDVPVEKPKIGDIGIQEMNSEDAREDFLQRNSSNKEELKISSVDFLGLDFSEKKNYKGRRPGLAPVAEPLFNVDFPEVEIIVGDASKVQRTTPQKLNIGEEKEDTSNIYKPKVSTWGVFPRPGNISKTFGGGRVIRPGDQLETAEDKIAKEKQTKELIAAYRKKMGFTIDAQTKLECEKALRDGDSLMDSGKLQEALPYYEKIMKSVIFQSELHGLAALQWSICQDSLRRPNEARSMYEKLQSHPNVQVSKKARQFVFSFQAMEMMKVKSSSVLRKTGYENYFDAFVEDKAKYSATEENQNEIALMTEGLPYIIFLLSPILLVFLVAVRKSFQF